MLPSSAQPLRSQPPPQPPLLPLLLLLLFAVGPVLACFSGQRQTAKVVENPMTEWSPWGKCDPLCGPGKQTRSRSSVLLPQERELQSRSCGVSCAELFEWSEWQEWSNCSLTCGSQGIRSRFRECRRVTDGFVNSQLQGACPGDGWMQAEPCNRIDCPPVYIWTPWSDWTQCTRTCGVGGGDGSGDGGRQDRWRQCQTDALETTETENCGQLANETRVCNENVPCPVEPDWQPWSQWSSCAVTCGPATVSRTRQRSCQPDLPPGLCIQPSVTTETERRDCDNPSCPAINGGWSQWNPWSNCLVTCGWGGRVRNRFCNNPPPSNGGADCGSSSAGYERCLGGECPVDGKWGAWTPCSTAQGSHCVTTPRGLCSAGMAEFCRQCDNPKPEFGGSPCATGLAIDRRECWNTDACDNSIVQPPMNFAVVGFLNTSDLLVTWRRAPYGLQASSFFITWAVTGTDTVGDADVSAVPQSEQKTLGESYSHWIRGLAPGTDLEVNIATRSTAGGTLRISRALREAFQVSRVDGGWGHWSPYGSCKGTLDCNTPGSRNRSRNCDSPSPANGGMNCPGSATETSRCFHPCR